MPYALCPIAPHLSDKCYIFRALPLCPLCPLRLIQKIHHLVFTTGLFGNTYHEKSNSHSVAFGSFTRIFG
jgi:hypothetical protein